MGRILLAIAFATIALLLATTEAVTVTHVNSSFVYAVSQFYRVELSHPNLTLYYRDRNGNFPGDRVVISFDQWKEQYRWGPTPNASGSMSNFSSVCTDSFSSGEYTFNHITWANGPEGSIILQANYSMGTPGSNCSILRQYYVTDKPATISIAGRNVTFTPEEVKISLLIVCPWREQLEDLLFLGPSDPLYIRARYSRFRFNLDLYFVSSFSFFPLPIVAPENTTLSTDWYEYARMQCAFSSQFDANGELPTSGRTLSPAFNYTETAGIIVQSEILYTGFLFLLWAHSDERQFTRSAARADDRTIIFRPESNFFSIKGNVSFEFYNTLEYDPTLLLLFTGDAATADTAPQAGNPQSAALNIDASSINLAAAISVPIVLVVTGTAIVVALVIISRRRNSEKAKLAARLDHGREAMKKTRSETATAKEAAPPAASKPSGWTRSKKPTTQPV